METINHSYQKMITTANTALPMKECQPSTSKKAKAETMEAIPLISQALNQTNSIPNIRTGKGKMMAPTLIKKVVTTILAILKTTIPAVPEVPAAQ